MTHPTVEVIAAMVVVILATWFVVQTEVDLRQGSHFGPVVVSPK